jgi:hypothetical protein
MIQDSFHVYCVQASLIKSQGIIRLQKELPLG